MSLSKNPDDYLVPKEKSISEIKVKGSRFIGVIIPCLTVEQAEQEYMNIKKKYYNATHNCFAWKMDAHSFRYSDDGEPSATAGKPILQVIEGKELFEVLCVVTRYFGGTKLGTGGLIRAYGECAADVISKTPLMTKTHWFNADILYDYSLENIVRRTLDEFAGKILDSNYSDSVEMKLAIPQSCMKDFKKKILEITNTAVKFK